MNTRKNVYLFSVGSVIIYVDFNDNFIVNDPSKARTSRHCHDAGSAHTSSDPNGTIAV
jgi:hypothetical protein